jgi:hypothetical protein
MTELLNMSKMNILRGVQLPSPRFQTSPLPEELLSVNGYSNLQTFFPTLTKLLRLGKWNPKEEIWMDTLWRVSSIDCSGTSGPCTVKLSVNKDVSGTPVQPVDRQAFLKVAHLLDPIQWIQGEYTLAKEPGLPWHPKGLQKAWQKLQDPCNQAYIDTICSYIVGRIREQDLSPHFNLFYGAFAARAKTYRYNLTDEFQSYRHESWLWKGLKKNRFAFKIINKLNPDEPVSEDVLKELLQEYDDNESLKSNVLDEIDVKDAEECSLHSDSMSDVSFEAPKSLNADSSSVSEISDEEDYTIYAEITDYPVMIIITEKNVDTMDMLFEDYDSVGARPGTDSWNARWTAWVFQIVAALSVAQSMIGLTHNDLHSNNIVWSHTEEKFLTYKLRSGMHFRVPTYGKVFRIIDYGRAIFRINGQRFISDDFKKGNDADGQYVFRPLAQKYTKEILPNPSFDLARLTVSMIDGIFPKTPPVKLGGDMLSKEPGLTVYETTSDLYNLIWTWMIDDMGKNIFTNPDGTERFPDFDLYKHIAEFIHGAVPCKQFFTPAFQVFRVDEESIGNEKVYSLFC